MSRIRSVVCAVACCFALSNTALAQFAGAPVEACPPQYGHSADGSWKVDYYRNNLWPTPFRAMDTMSVLAAFDVVIRLGLDRDGKYCYTIKSKEDNEGKKRVKLPEEMPADFMKVWNETKQQLGIG